jgi:hypothetical protein
MNGNYLITLELGGSTYKLCRIFFGKDGTYYVTSPYHQIKTAFLLKATVNYDTGEQYIPVADALDSAEFDDEDGRIKLSHHPSGYLHFSGKGVLSGKAEDGAIKGIGVQSWTLDRPARGPAFVVSINGIESLETTASTAKDTCSFVDSELSLLPDPKTIVLEGHYFPSLWRRFVRRSQHDWPELSVTHPNGANVPLKVILPAASCAMQGFLGLELYSSPRTSGPENGFFLSGSTGNLRTNAKGQHLGDGIFCLYPRAFLAKRSLHWPPPSHAHCL